MQLAIWPLRGSRLEPRPGVDGLARLADLEVQLGTRSSARIAQRGDGVTGRDALASFLVEPFVVGVQAVVAIAVIDDGQQSQAREPVRVNHAAVIDGAHRRALRTG